MRYMKIFILALFIAAPSMAKEPGESGGQVLKMGADARATAMGEAGCALEGDANSVYWNPASLSDIENQQIYFTHMTKLLGLRFSNMSYARPLGGGVLGGALFVLYTEDTRRDVLGNDLGGFRDYNSFFILSYAEKLNSSLSAGASLKLVFNRLDDYESGNIAFDAGLKYRRGGLSLGANVQNIATGISPSGDEETLPLNLKLGAAVNLSRDFLLAFDANFPNDSNPVLHAGAEYCIAKAFKLRTGYKKFTDSHYLGGMFGFNAGFGITYGRYKLDYDYSPTEALGKRMHRMTLGLFF